MAREFVQKKAVNGTYRLVDKATGVVWKESKEPFEGYEMIETKRPNDSNKIDEM